VQFQKGVNVMEAFSILPDPQTNGGLLVALKPSAASQVQQLFIDEGIELYKEPIGRFIKQEEKIIRVLE